MISRALLAIAALLALPRSALAYRPFDGTDADVAEPRELELEIGPLGYARAGGSNVLVAPALIANYGLAPRLELVVEGKEFVLLGDLAPGQSRTSVSSTAANLKWLMRRGSLHGETGLSVASEWGVLLPTWNDEPGVGALGVLVMSYRWAALTAHLNAEAFVARSHAPGAMGSLILEGPWEKVRPVAELLVEKEFDGGAIEISALAGLIWEAADGVAFDLGIRGARTSEAGATENELEIRAGLTWGFELFGGREAARAP